MDQQNDLQSFPTYPFDAPTSCNHRPCRWKTCSTITKKLVNELIRDEHGFHKDEMKDTLHKFFEHDKLRDLFL